MNYNNKNTASMDYTEVITVATNLRNIKPDCKECGMGIACLGCPADTRYRKQYKAMTSKFGKEKIDAAMEYVALKQAVEAKTAELKKLEKECADALNKYMELHVQ